MEKLPELKAGMPIGQACYLELMHILVEENILTLQRAIFRYQQRKLDFSGIDHNDWNLYER
jgi:hypothetical protein